MNRKMSIDAAVASSFALDAYRRGLEREKKARKRARLRQAKAGETTRDDGAQALAAWLARRAIADAASALDALGIGYSLRRTVARIALDGRGKARTLRRPMKPDESLFVRMIERERASRPRLLDAAQVMSSNGGRAAQSSAAIADAATTVARLSDAGWSDDARVPHGTLFVGSVAVAKASDESTISGEHGSRHTVAASEQTACGEAHLACGDNGAVIAHAITLRLSWLDSGNVRRFKCVVPTEIPVDAREAIIGQIAAHAAREFSVDASKVKVCLTNYFLPIESARGKMATATVPARDEIRASGACFHRQPKVVASDVRMVYDRSVAKRWRKAKIRAMVRAIARKRAMERSAVERERELVSAIGGARRRKHKRIAWTLRAYMRKVARAKVARESIN